MITNGNIKPLLANYKTTESIYERNQRLYAANAVAKQNLK